jgi:hypothetical protein
VGELVLERTGRLADVLLRPRGEPAVEISSRWVGECGIRKYRPAFFGFRQDELDSTSFDLQRV